MSVQAQVSIEPIRKYEGTNEYRKTQQYATIFDFKNPEKDLENALEEYLKKQRRKVKSSKGFLR